MSLMTKLRFASGSDGWIESAQCRRVRWGVADCAKRLSCVLGMLSSLEVKVLRPT